MDSVIVTYFVHGTTIDNQQGIATGWAPGELSELGKEQSIRLWDMIKDRYFDIVISSDLKRAIDSADLTFQGRVPIIHDARLRECNYGDLTRGDGLLVDSMTLQCVDKPFPNGESYRDVERRIRDLCNHVIAAYRGKHVAFVSHRGPQLALEVIVNGKSWERAIKEDWRYKEAWRPGWDYVPRGWY